MTQFLLHGEMRIAVAGLLCVVFSMIAYASPLSAMVRLIYIKTACVSCNTVASTPHFVLSFNVKLLVENGGDHKECGIHAFPSLIHLFLEWRSLDCLCLTRQRLVCWSKLPVINFCFGHEVTVLYSDNDPRQLFARLSIQTNEFHAYKVSHIPCV